MASHSGTDLIALTGCSGKIGGAVLHNILKYKLILPTSLVITTSASPSSAKFASLRDQGITIRQLDYGSHASQVAAFQSCTRLLLVSNPNIAQDFGYPDTTPGRESVHLATMSAALEAGVKHIYYTSLAFDSDSSKAGVMRAHNATERELTRLGREKGLGWTSIREGLYNESWPLYLGHWDLEKDTLTKDGGGREEVVLADYGKGEVCWASIDDLGLGTATILAEEVEKWNQKTFVLNSTNVTSLEEVASLVGEKRKKDVRIRRVERGEHERHYVQERGMDEGMIRWWASTYEAIKDGEAVNGDRTLEGILARYERKLTPIDETIGSMLP